MSGISMMPAAPVAVPTPAPAASKAGDAAAEPGVFASLMAGLLGEDTAVATGDAGGAGGAATDETDQTVADADSVLVAAAVPVANPAAAAIATPVAVAPAAPGTADSEGSTESTTSTLPQVAADGGVEVTRTYGCTTGMVVKGGPRAPELPGLPGTPGQPAASTQPGQPGGVPATGPAPEGAGDGTASPGTAQAVPATAATAVPAPATATDPGAAAPATAAPQPVVPNAAVTPPAVTAPLTAAGPVHAGPHHIPDQVTAQVFPEIGRLAVRASSGGEGIHRITLNLHPETLGDVRVTLSVRGGEMKINIHAATEAGRIMAEGLPELRRLLGHAGADAIVAVRDTGAGGATLSTADQGSNRSDLSRSGYDAHQQQRDAQGRDARTREGHFATDGSNSGPRGSASGPLNQVRASRSAGVDVTV
ncbi:flagellar hook-length control protein FliK [Nocardioides sp. LHG3406-4]|uniref:flagellar hook-length control protein FliK n=1 Tax=Nocardioides sp. LHG3406-4 TaxID=2804575 RepID=UPI003CF3E47C